MRGEKVATLFSYVVDHDLGFAPNPSSGYCTLVHCKFGGIGRRRNIVELAKAGDWVLGTGGQNKDSAGNSKLIYLMRVDEKLPFERFLADPRFRGRRDCKNYGSGNKYALIALHYFYFGRNALEISELPDELAPSRLVKRGPWFRRDYPADKLKRLVKWFERNYEVGTHGDPCKGRSRLQKHSRATKC
jgi:Nucleotide modification associated domain 2